MPEKKLSVKWSNEAINDLKSTYYDLRTRNSNETALKIRNEIFNASRSIIFPEQFQLDENGKNCRRIIIRNFKILYIVDGETIRITSVINTYHNY